MRIRIRAAAIIVLLGLLPGSAAAQDPFADARAVREWSRRLDDSRRVVDRVVVCFDERSVLRELAKWDAERFWPVLLWESDLVPKFVEAFRPAQVLLATYEDGGPLPVEGAMRTVAAAWGAVAGDVPPSTKSLLATLRDRDRPPMGTVLIAGGSPELLGGVALAAGRFHLPLVLETPGKHAKSITAERTDELRKDLAARLVALGLDFDGRLDELDFVTVANDMPFGYRPSDPRIHPGGYTVDDAIARNDDFTRWGWVGRLVGGSERSVYMAMGALFLRPETGLFWSRYAPKHPAFGRYDPAPAKETFEALFPTTIVNHPDATLARWRELQGPRGNRHGFVFVNSSGGARGWSTSKGQATHFDVPDTMPTIVHYTHSGSAGRPFDVDSIAGRWMAGGAYVYFGSYAEPYLTAFVPPSVLAARVKLGVPLAAAMRHPYSEAMVGQRRMKVGETEKDVRFNLSGPWKLAYFGDPTVRLGGEASPREEPGPRGKEYHVGARAFGRARRPTEAARRRHALASLGLVRLDPAAKKLVDERAWAKLAKGAAQPPDAAALLRETTRLWAASLRRVLAGDGKVARKTGVIPAPIRTLLGAKADSPDAARIVAEVAKEAVAHGGKDGDPALAARVLRAACCFPHPSANRKPFFAWVKEACVALDREPSALRKEVLAERWLPDAVRKAVEAGLPAKATAK